MARTVAARGGFASAGARPSKADMTRMTVNGQALHYKLDPETPLLWALREASNLTGTKYGCDTKDCGACTVIIDGRAVMSCSVSIASLEGADITTIEGLSADRAHPVQQAWAAEQVSQCGYCEPGFIMAIAALLRASPSPSPEQIDALPNLCRCGAYVRIRKAIARAAQQAAPVNPVATPMERLSGGSSEKEQLPSSNRG
jgi:isoquinoline 1-oxidoreductase alpha subunit